MADADAARPFLAGDHLRVWRPLPVGGYYHHGIYIGGDRVVQFGGSICDKRNATIGAVSLETFERGATALVVHHGGRTWWGAPRFEAIAREVTVRRAERLIEAHPSGLYDLFGYNCEQAANFCATNSYESYQVRGYFAVRSLIDGPVLLYLASRQRDGRRLSGSAMVGIALWFLLGFVPNVLYHLRGARFMARVGRPLLAREQSEKKSHP